MREIDIGIKVSCIYIYMQNLSGNELFFFPTPIKKKGLTD